MTAERRGSPLRGFGLADRTLAVAGAAPGGLRRARSDDWRYDRFEVGDDELPAFVDGLDASWRGLSLTMPLKEAALGLGEPDPVAVGVRAANTLIFDAEGRRVYNTDVEGLVTALRRSPAAR